MSDLALHRRSDGNFDLDFDEAVGDLRLDDGFENAVAISIGSFARDERLGQSANLRPCLGGWWGDALYEKGSLGGFVYKVISGKLTDASARDAKKYAVDALSWLIDDGVAKSIDCESKVDGENVVLNISLTFANGSVFSETYKMKVG